MALELPILFAGALLIGACGPGYVDSHDIANKQYQNDDPGQQNANDYSYEACTSTLLNPFGPCGEPPAPSPQP